jgi:hypothetical protein
VELRITNGSEAMLTYEEMQSAEDSTEVAIVQIPTGNIVVASTNEKFIEISKTNVLRKYTAVVPIGKNKIACSQDGVIKICNYHTGKILQTIDDHKRVLSYTLHPG